MLWGWCGRQWIASRSAALMFRIHAADPARCAAQIGFFCCPLTIASSVSHSLGPYWT
jgi:hypothetical protein